ncbi:MAG: hypothetical protein H0X30_32225 [Anaerolineae bacterium]|nr:hypothetical protein [Anaerolineae bacterium]
MPVQLSWYLENRVILMVNHDGSSDQELLELDQPVINYLNQSNASLVHLIWNNNDSKYMPSINATKALQFPKHPQFGWTITVGLNNPLQRFIVAVANAFFKSRVRMVNTMDEALDFLNEVDGTLPALRDNVLDKAS